MNHDLAVFWLAVRTLTVGVSIVFIILGSASDTSQARHAHAGARSGPMPPRTASGLQESLLADPIQRPKRASPAEPGYPNKAY